MSERYWIERSERGWLGMMRGTAQSHSIRLVGRDLRPIEEGVERAERLAKSLGDEAAQMRAALEKWKAENP